MAKRILCLFLLLALTLSVSLVAAEGMAYREYPISATIMLEGCGNVQYEQTLDLKSGDYFRVELFAAGGTGYQWTLENENPELIKLVYQNSGPVDAAKNIAGGKARTVFIFQATSSTNTPEVLHFALKRPWEKAEKPAQTMELSVTAR